MKNRKMIGLVIAVILSSGVGVACVTLKPGQAAAVHKMSQQSSEVAILLSTVENDIQKIRDMVKNGEISFERAQETITTLLARKAELTSKYKEIQTTIREAKDSGVPWWGYLASVVPTILTVAGAGKYSMVLKAFGALSRAATASNGSDKKLGEHVEDELIGARGLSKDEMTSLHNRAKDRNI